MSHKYVFTYVNLLSFSLELSSVNAPWILKKNMLFLEGIEFEMYLFDLYYQFY